MRNTKPCKSHVRQLYLPFPGFKWVIKKKPKKTPRGSVRDRQLDARAARMVRRRLEAVEEWIIVKGMKGAEKADLLAWERLLETVLPEVFPLPPDSDGVEVPPPLGADLDDAWGLVARQSPGNHVKAAASIGGQPSLPPVKVRLQGPEAPRCRRDLVELSGGALLPGEREHFTNEAHMDRVYTERDDRTGKERVVSRELGRAGSRVSRPRKG